MEFLEPLVSGTSVALLESVRRKRLILLLSLKALRVFALGGLFLGGRIGFEPNDFLIPVNLAQWS